MVLSRRQFLGSAAALAQTARRWNLLIITNDQHRADCLALPSQNQTRELRERPINIDSGTICRLDERMAYSAECPEATVDAENTVNALLECKALGANAGRLSKYQAVCLVTSSNTAPCLIRSNSA